MTRRDALKLAAIAGATATTATTGSLGVAGCAPPPPSSTEATHPKQSTAEALQGEAMSAKNDPAASAVLEMLPLGFPWQTRDPFLFCVHHDDAYPKGNEVMGPEASLAGRDIGMDFAGKDGWRMYHGERVPGFPQHPHRGFETVTVVRRGMLDHSDSLGAAARYGGGDVQWLTAGAGILHSEMFPLIQRDVDNPVELFQIWLNLPSVDKMATPHFSMLWSEGGPRRALRDAEGRETALTIVAGRYQDATPAPPPPSSWATRSDTDVAIWTLKLAPGARFTLPAAQRGTNRSLYFFRGSELLVGGVAGKPDHRIDLRADADVELRAGRDEVELLMLQGRPIGEPVAKHGPFVMNTMDEIRQAYADYRATQFGGWPWPSDEPVHARAEGRFARHASGKLERPT